MLLQLSAGQPSAQSEPAVPSGVNIQNAVVDHDADEGGEEEATRSPIAKHSECVQCGPDKQNCGCNDAAQFAPFAPSRVQSNSILRTGGSEKDV